MKKLAKLLSLLSGVMMLSSCGLGDLIPSSDNPPPYDPPVAPIACADGSYSCGSYNAARQYDEKIIGSSGRLFSANNVEIGSGESVALIFSARGMSNGESVTVNFKTTSGYSNSSESFTFVGNESGESSYTFILQTTANISSYSITPSVGIYNMNNISVNTITTSRFELPLGTYKDNSVYINKSDDGKCTPILASNQNAKIINTMNGVYYCYSISGTSSCDKSNVSSRFDQQYLPSGEGSAGDYFNAGWSNGQFISTSLEGSSSRCAGMINKINWQYQSESTAIPFPVTN